ncbi:AAA family ATPase, partial [Aeribacillus composti]|nr:AAA family ATPase [Aeribacillus composti]
MITEAKTLKSVSEYVNLSVQDKFTYVCEAIGLKTNYLIGKILTPREGANYFLVGDLINPYTGLPIGQILSNAERTESAICYGAALEAKGLEPDDLVLFQFQTPQYNLQKVEKGEILNVIKESIVKLEDCSELFSKLGITIEDLKVLGLIEVDNNDKFSIFPVTELSKLYKDLIETKAEEYLKEIEDKLNLLKNKEERVKKLEEQLSKIQQEVEEKSKKLKLLGFNVFRGYEEKSASSKNINSLEKPEVEKELVQLIQQQIALRGLNYEKDTIRRFYCALKTNQFVILSGPSGTGKTSLVSAFAEVVSAKAKIIPVQPSWTDKQDLLGFYNPIRKQYVPSVFLDTLV